jgi:hypothetical protein
MKKLILIGVALALVWVAWRVLDYMCFYPPSARPFGN